MVRCSSFRFPFPDSPSSSPVSSVVVVISSGCEGPRSSDGWGDTTSVTFRPRLRRRFLPTSGCDCFRSPSFTAVTSSAGVVVVVDFRLSVACRLPMMHSHGSYSWTSATCNYYVTTFYMFYLFVCVFSYLCICLSFSYFCLQLLANKRSLQKVQGHRARLGLGPVLVYCTDCTPVVDSGPVTLYLMQWSQKTCSLMSNEYHKNGKLHDQSIN